MAVSGGEGRVLVLGGSGFLGREIVARLRDRHELVLTHLDNPCEPGSQRFDVFNDDPALVLAPDVGYVLCAARLFDAQQDGGEHATQRRDALQRFLLAAADRRFLLVSTDAVFSGREGQYRETDAREPVTAYGQRMRDIEDQLASTVPDHCILRTSYLYGYSAGQLDKRLGGCLDKLTRGETPAFFDDMYKSPVAVGDMAQAACAMLFSGHVGPAHAGTERLSVYEFHRQAMAALTGDTPAIEATRMPDRPGLARDTSLAGTPLPELAGLAARRIPDSLTPRRTP